jgi:hypothetical protein
MSITIRSAIDFVNRNIDSISNRIASNASTGATKSFFQEAMPYIIIFFVLILILKVVK